MTTTESKSQIGFWPFMVISMAWYGYAYYVSQSLATQVFGLVFLNVFIFAIPIALSGAYSLAVNQARTVSFYRQGGWAYWLFSRRFIKALLWITWSLVTSFLMLVLFVSYSKIDWVGLAALIPIYWIIQTKSRHFLASELKKGYVLTNYSITWARWICLVIVLIFYGVLIIYFDEPSSYRPLLDTVIEQQKVIVQDTGSLTVRFALEISTFKDGFQLWMIQHLGQFGKIWPQLLGILGGVIIFFNATATLSSFVIHQNEYRRIFGPITDDDVPAPLFRKTIALSSAIVTFFLLFICLPLTAAIEESIHAHPDWLYSIQTTETQLYTYAEQIDNKFYKSDTIKKIQAKNLIALGKMSDPNLRAVLEGSIDKAFDQMEANVDDYLDWYYSLGADVARLANLMTGKIETNMKVELEKRLNKGEVTQKLSDGISQLLAINKTIDDERQTAVKKILEENNLPNDGSKVNITQSMSLKDMFSMPDYILGATDFNNRLATDGLVATGIGAAVITKVISKGVFKVAAKALSKVALNEAGAAGPGALIGGAVGSIIPVVGTAVGAAAGAIIAGIFLDKGILMLEELTDRKDFKDKIIAGIRESKAEFKDKIFKNQPLTSPEDQQVIAKAEQGDAVAQVSLGLKYQNGDGVEKNDKVAVEWYRKAADQGNSDAQANLGGMYQNGTGVDKSNEQAVFWYRKSADQGNASGENLLGVMSVIEAEPKIKKAETKKDDKEVAAKLREEANLLFKEAVSWFRKSADQGNSQAQLNLGVMYQKGFGTEENNEQAVSNNEQAVSWFRKSAEQDNSDAQLNLGAMYQNGAGVEKSNEQAVSWYRKSAEQDNRDAQVSLGVMYQNGEGVEQSDEKALFWYQKSTVINSKSNVHLFDTRAYKPNFSGLSSLKGVDEYVVAESKNTEIFQGEKRNSFIHIWVEISEEAYYKYNVALSTLRYDMEGETLVFTVPKLNLSLPVATNSSTYKDKCKGKVWPFPTAKDSSCKLPGFKEPLETLTVQKTSVLQQRGEARKETAYEMAAKSLADNFNAFAKNNDKEIFYKNIAVVFADEPHQLRRVFNYNKNYCGKELCKEVLLGNGRILTVH
jgi:TPR repeat protein